MNIGEILVWESSKLLLLIPAVIGLLVLTRWLKERTVGQFSQSGIGSF
jgi:hypothetical protein